MNFCAAADDIFLKGTDSFIFLPLCVVSEVHEEGGAALNSA